jgi:hypothetical protein
MREVGGEIDVHISALEFDCDQRAWRIREHGARALVGAKFVQRRKCATREDCGDAEYAGIP